MAMMIMRYCLSVILVLLYKHYAAEAAITPSFSPDELVVCPGDQATFSCTVVDIVNSQSTIWMANTTADECALVHVLAFHGDTCGPFSAALGAQDGDCFPSTLTVTATTDLDNTFVQCFGPSPDTRVGNGTLQVVGPPSAPVLTLSEQDITSSGDTNTRNVKLHWAILDRYPEFISRYILTTDPSVQPCGGSCTLEPGSMEFMLGEYEFELTVGESYTFGIRADNCDNTQTGAMSDQLTVNLRVPLAPADCSSTPTYDQALGTLKTIDIEWDIIPVPLEEIAPGIGGGVSEYEITFQPDIGDPVVDTIDSGDCTAGVCSLEFTSDMSVTSYTSVTVTGQNLVGSGPARVCKPQPINMMNNLLQVTVIARVVNATVECRFQSGFIGSARCRIDYGSDSRNPAYSDESSESGSAGDTVTILLSQTLDPNTTYYYSVYTIGATETNVQSQGSFRSECNPVDLGNTTMTLDPRCQEVGNSVATPNGIVCYESTTADSEAIYMCNSGYQLDGGVSTRVCQQDGQWDLPVPTCTAIPPTSCNSHVLGMPSEANDPQCRVQETTLHIENGVVCYTRFLAYYICDSGYNLMVDGEATNPRICQNNGEWNGTAPLCVAETTECKDTSDDTTVLAIVGGIAGGVVLLLLLVVMLLAIAVWKYRCQVHKTGKINLEQNVAYDTHSQWQVQPTSAPIEGVETEYEYIT